MDFRDFLIVAEQLARGDLEAQWRSAVSRAYYAAFHVAGGFLRDLGFAVPRSDRAHAFLWLRLSNCGDAGMLDAGRLLQDMRNLRNRADYDERQSISQADAHRTVLLSGKVIERLDAFVSDALGTQITETIKIYERDVLKEVTWKPT